MYFLYFLLLLLLLPFLIILFPFILLIGFINIFLGGSWNCNNPHCRKW